MLVFGIKRRLAVASYYPRGVISFVADAQNLVGERSVEVALVVGGKILRQFGAFWCVVVGIDLNGIVEQFAVVKKVDALDGVYMPRVGGADGYRYECVFYKLGAAAFYVAHYCD